MSSSNVSSTSTGTFPVPCFSCSQCSFSSFDPRNFHNHLESPEHWERGFEEKEEGLQCGICGKGEFRDKEGFREHLRDKVYTHTAKRQSKRAILNSSLPFFQVHLDNLLVLMNEEIEEGEIVEKEQEEEEEVREVREIKVEDVDQEEVDHGQGENGDGTKEREEEEREQTQTCQITLKDFRQEKSYEIRGF